MSLTLIFFPLGAAAVAAAGFAEVAVVSFFVALADDAASALFTVVGDAASAGDEAGVDSTVADAFSSVAGAVDSAGVGDSS